MWRAGVCGRLVGGSSRSLLLRLNARRSVAAQVEKHQQRKWKHFSDVEVRPNGVAIIRIDSPDSKVNTMTDSFRRELEELWREEVESRSGQVKAVVWASAKKVSERGRAVGGGEWNGMEWNLT